MTVMDRPVRRRRGDGGFGWFLLKRALSACVVLAIVSAAIFTLIRLAPGDPIDLMLDPQARAQAGPDYVESVRARLGLDQPIPVQFVSWLRELADGNLGYSFASRVPVADVMSDRLGPTVILMGVAMLLGVVVAIPVGVVSAMRRNSAVDYVTSALSMLALSSPNFFLGMLGIYVFSVRLGWLPSAGMATTGGSGSFMDQLAHLVMPAGILGLVIAAQLARYVRSGLVDALRADYVRTARAKGGTELRIVFAHAFRNSIGPLITVIAIMLPRVLAGAVVIETVFAWPGMGQLIVSAVAANDYAVVVAFAMYVAVLVVVFNFVADVLYAVADPRIRYAS
jgi:ABC-type dipeptide/oligopeptide/nickel transport system permease component